MQKEEPSHHGYAFLPSGSCEKRKGNTSQYGPNAWNHSSSDDLDDYYLSISAFHGNKLENQLSFDEGQRIRVIARDPSGWWTGEISFASGKRIRGLFPQTYVAPAPSEASDVSELKEIEPQWANEIEGLASMAFLDAAPFLVLALSDRAISLRMAVKTAAFTHLLVMACQCVRYRHGSLKVFPKLWQGGLSCMQIALFLHVTYWRHTLTAGICFVAGMESAFLILIGLSVDRPFLLELAQDIVEEDKWKDRYLVQSATLGTWAWAIVAVMFALLGTVHTWMSLIIRTVLMASSLVLTYRWFVRLALSSFKELDVSLDGMKLSPDLGNPFRSCLASANCIQAPSTPTERSRRRSSSGGVVPLTSPTSMVLAIPRDAKMDRYSTAGSLGADSVGGVCAEYFTFNQEDDV